MPQRFFQQRGPDHVTIDMHFAVGPSDSDKQLCLASFFSFSKPLHIGFTAASIFSLLWDHLFYLL